MRRTAMLLGMALTIGGLAMVPAEKGTAQTLPRVLVQPVPGVFRLPVAIAQHPDGEDLYGGYTSVPADRVRLFATY